MTKRIAALIVLMMFSSARGQTTQPLPRPIAAPTNMVDFRGTVLDDETGAPVEVFSIQFGRSTAQSNGEIQWGLGGTMRGRRVGGRFSQRTPVPSDQKAGIRIMADGYLPAPIVAEPPNPTTDLVIRLKRGAKVSGVVLDHAGKPVEGARVVLAGAATVSFFEGAADIPTPLRNEASYTGGVKTDAQGRFILTGITGESDQRIVAVGPGGGPHALTSKFSPAEELTIRLPEPATLVIKYDIPGAEPESMVRIAPNTPSAEWRNIRIEYIPKVKNQSQIELKGLTPGTYDISRQKQMRAGTTGRSAMLDRSLTTVLEAGKATEISWVRKKGYPIHGEIVGMGAVNPEGGFVYVRSADATGEPRNVQDALRPTFDAVNVGPDGIFDTGLLEPGTYTIIAEAYASEAGTTTFRTGVQLAAQMGMTKVTITEGQPPDTVLIVLKPRDASNRP